MPRQPTDFKPSGGRKPTNFQPSQDPNTPITNKVGSYFEPKIVDLGEDTFVEKYLPDSWSNPELAKDLNTLYPNLSTEKGTAFLRGAASSQYPVPKEMAETLTNFPVIRGAEMAARTMNPDLPEVPYTPIEDVDMQRHELTKYLESKAPGYQRSGEITGMALPFLPALENSVSNKLGAAKKWFSGLAEKNALKATGATPGQVYKLPEDAARELLKRRAIRFGDNVEDVAKRARKILDESGQEIGNVIKKLDDAGVQIDKEQIYNEILDSAEGLGGNEARHAVQNKLQDIASRIEGQAKMVPDVNSPYPKTDKIFPKVKPSEAEGIKRDFQSLSNYNDKSATMAEKATGDAYREATEQAALQYDPALAETFKREKETFGLFKPIEEAATKRALQQNQSASIGMGDMMASGAGGVVSGGTGAVAAPFLKRMVNARYPSSAAVTQDTIANLIPTGFFGEYSPMLEAAMQKGPQQLAITHYLLSKDPQYQQLFNSEE